MSVLSLESLSQFASLSRRRLLGGSLLTMGSLMAGFGAPARAERVKEKGRVLLGRVPNHPPGLDVAVNFPLIEALLGRRARRFSVGSEIPDGALQYKSTQDPMPLSPLEQMMILAAVGGNTGWHYMITRHAGYAPKLSNYSGGAGGRTFPSSMGLHTCELFYTDDDGVYFLPTRDSGSLMPEGAHEQLDLQAWLEAHRKRIRKLADGRLNIPAKEPSMEGHNTWCANRPGSTLIFPVADVAQHNLGILWFLVQNRYCLYDDVNNQPIPGIEKFAHLVDTKNPYPLTFVEQYALTEATVEIATSCYAGALMLQAVGLGGWMYDGIDRFTVLGASGDPEVPGLGFHHEKKEGWSVPNFTGLPGVFEGYCPPHFPDMRAAVEAFAERKYGAGGPFNAATPGPWKESGRIRSAAAPATEELKECVALQAQYLYDRFGKFPATVPSIFSLMYLQAHHLDLGFYDKHFGPGAYLETHRRHMELWHGRKA